jgi:hypothetical protein
MRPRIRLASLALPLSVLAAPVALAQSADPNANAPRAQYPAQQPYPNYYPYGQYPYPYYPQYGQYPQGQYQYPPSPSTTAQPQRAQYP